MTPEFLSQTLKFRQLNLKESNLMSENRVIDMCGCVDLAD